MIWRRSRRRRRRRRHLSSPMSLVRTTLKLQCDRGYNGTDNKTYWLKQLLKHNLLLKIGTFIGRKIINSPEYHKTLEVLKKRAALQASL